MKKRLIVSGIAVTLLMAPVAQADIDTGIAALEARELETALSEFKEALASADTHFTANWRIGETLVKMGKPKDAIEYLEAAVEENPNHADAHYWLGAANGQTASDASIFSAAGYAKACLKGFERAVELDPSHLEAREGLVRYYLEAPGFMGGDKEKALEQAEAIKEHDAERGYLNIAAVHMDGERAQMALDAYNALLEAQPNSAHGYFNRGALHRQEGRMDAAYEDFKTLANLKAPTADKADNDADKEAQAHLSRLGLYYMAAVASQTSTKITEGISHMEAYLAGGDFDVPLRENYGYYYLASLHLAAGNPEKAKEMAARAGKGHKDKDLRKMLKRLNKQIKKA